MTLFVHPLRESFFQAFHSTNAQIVEDTIDQLFLDEDIGVLDFIALHLNENVESIVSESTTFQIIMDFHYEIESEAEFNRKLKQR